jgi:hypothetical protein
MSADDAKLAASIGLVLGWTSWQALLTGTFAGFALAAVYGGVRLATHQASRTSQLPLGPFILLGTLSRGPRGRADYWAWAGALLIRRSSGKRWAGCRRARGTR